MTYRPGRLRRVLADIGIIGANQTMLGVSASDLGSWDDNRIQSVTMTRGSRTQAAGIMPGTATVNVAGALPTSVDSILGINLSFLAVGGLIYHTGALDLGLSRDDLRNRWVGRIAAQTVTDRGPARQSTQLKAGLWSSLYTGTGVTVTPQDNDPGENGLHLPVFYTQAWNLAKLHGTITTASDLQLSLDMIGQIVTVDQLVDEFGARVGVWWHTRRDGNVHALDTAALWNIASSYADAAPIPIARRHAIAPATWEQPATEPFALSYKRLMPDSPQQSEYKDINVYPSRRGRPLYPAVVDTTHVYDATSGPGTAIDSAMLAHANRGAGLWYQIPELTFDLLALLQSDDITDRHLVAQLLALETYQPVALGVDWVSPAAGVSFPLQITETITPDSWTIRLGLQRLEYVTGQTTSDVFVPGTRWHNAYPPETTFDQTTNAWNDPPTWIS